MLMRSISTGSTDVTDQHTASRVMRTYSRSRSSAVTVFESQIRGMYRSGFSTTADATTGPARQPRPTSSTPATYTNPIRRSAFSRVRYARTFTMAKLRNCGIAESQNRKLQNFQFRNSAILRALLFSRFLHARGLALQLAQEVQLGSAHLCRAKDFD